MILFDLTPCLLFGMLALYSWGVGLRGIVTRKPFLMSTRWILGVCLIAFTPGLLVPFFLALARALSRVGEDLPLLHGLAVLMFLFVAYLLWSAMRGYLAYAVTDTSLRDGLLAALQQLGIPYEEELGRFRLPSVGMDLQVEVQSWTGTARLKAREERHARVLRDIVKSMNDYYKCSVVSANLISSYFHMLLGAFMILLAVLRFRSRVMG